MLVVDDEDGVADSYADALSAEYDVIVAYSGEEALAELHPGVDIVLLDRRMPGISGDEVLAEIDSRHSDPRVVMVTAVEPDLDIVEMAFDEYLVKPVTAEQLRNVVERMLARKTLDQQVQRMFVLASKLATLESKLSLDQLETSDEYEALRAEFNTLRDEVELPDAEDDPYLEAALEKLEALLQSQ
ncbi:HoxA-like transcriptional regulator [Halobacteriales archaeon QS_4_66_20]|nr:MAG: HoxA-like transcriptional regulator [Halobacteriales archaeon QS_4_66_20]